MVNGPISPFLDLIKNKLPIVDVYNITEHPDVFCLDMHMESAVILKKIMPRLGKIKKMYILSGSYWKPDYIDLGCDYEVITYSHWLYAWVGIADKAPLFEPGPKPYKFCSLVGKDRYPREMWINHLLKKFPKKDYILNFQGKMLAQDSSTLDNIVISKKEIAHRQGLNLPFELLNSCNFNIVFETDVTQTDIFLTEKTLRSLAIGQPFVVYGQYNFYEHLHHLGFKTYDSVVSENFDNTGSYSERGHHLFRRVETLYHTDWAKHKDLLEDIQQHNRNVFVQGFKKQYEKELDHCAKILNTV